MARHTALTGRTPLPPRWALGFHQCRWSYLPESRVRLLASTFREKRVPADTLWLDIDYQDGFKPFTWDRERFPDPARMIVDPHPTKEPGYRIYDEGIAGGHFVKSADGTVFEGPVWPSNAAKSPGNSVLPDFTRPATREWWGRLYEDLLDIGVAGRDLLVAPVLREGCRSTSARGPPSSASPSSSTPARWRASRSSCFAQRRDAGGVTVEAAAVEGGYRPAALRLTIER